MLFVSGGANSHKEILVARWAATILRRSVPPATKAQRSFTTRVARNNLLDRNLVLPVVAEIVNV